jgi:hypothetical protein
VGQHQAARVELAFQGPTIHPRLACDRERALVDLQDPVEPGEIEHQAAVHGHGTALGARAAAPRHHGHAVLVRRAQRRGHLGFARGPCDQLRPSERLPLGLSVQAEPVGVGHVRVEPVGRFADGAIAELAVQFAPELVRDGRCAQC